MRRSIRVLASFALSVAGLVTALALSEATARLADGMPLFAWRLPQPLAVPPPPRHLDPTIGGGALPADVDPAWLDASPPPLQRKPVDRKLWRHAGQAERAGIRSFELFRVWNRRFVELVGCRPGNEFKRWPVPLLVFEPPEPIAFPSYRYLPSQTLPGGMTTNRYGWRGPDIPLDKPSGTVRIAFVGASTTVGLHGIPFSYPDYVVHWLNLWSERAGLKARFDGINAGREGLSPAHIAAVIRQEVVPAEPDLVVYYEGANDSLCVRRTRSGPPPPPPPQGRARILAGQFVAATRNHSALARRLDGLLLLVDARGGYELEKPALDVDWPAALDELHPDIDSPALPPHLRERVEALESARLPLAASGGELAISSFVYMVQDGMRIDVRRHSAIYRHMNELCWPTRYADQRRDVDLGNNLLREYAARRGLTFLDVARDFPPDLDLFSDGVHLNEDGTRVHAWIVFRDLLPLVRSRLESGRWPQPDRAKLSAHPGIGPNRPFTLSCTARGR